MSKEQKRDLKAMVKRQVQCMEMLGEEVGSSVMDIVREALELEREITILTEVNKK